MDVEYLLAYPGENDTTLKTRSEVLNIDSIIRNREEDDVEDDSSRLEPIPRKEALKATTTLRNLLLQYDKTTPWLLGAVEKDRSEIQLDLAFNKKKQTIIDSYFKKAP